MTTAPPPRPASVDLAELIGRLEAATEGGRELDADIAATVLDGEIIWKQHRFTGDMFPSRRFQTAASLSGYASEPVLEYSSSADAALSLVPKGWRLDYLQQSSDGTWWDARVEAINDGSRFAETEGGCPTPALAIVIAALRARQGGGG